MLLWVSMLFLMAGTQMQMLAQGYLAYEITGSGAILGYINLGIAVPLLTVPLFGGALADKIDRKLLIQGAQLVAALLALVLGADDRRGGDCVAASYDCLYGAGRAVFVHDAGATGYHSAAGGAG